MKTHTLKPGDKVTLNTSIMARSLVSHCRYLGILDQPAGVLAVSGQRVYVEWRDALFLGWFDADALTAEVVQPGLGL